MAAEQIRVSRSLRRGLLAYLAVLLAVGFTSSELWPLSSFHLFSGRQHEFRRAYAVQAVLPDGSEQGISFNTLPVGLRHTQRQISDFAEWSQSRRDESCDEWIEAIRAEGTPARFIRIYWAKYEMKTSRRVTAALRYVCGSDRPPESSEPA